MPMSIEALEAPNITTTNTSNETAETQIFLWLHGTWTPCYDHRSFLDPHSTRQPNFHPPRLTTAYFEYPMIEEKSLEEDNIESSSFSENFVVLLIYVAPPPGLGDIELGINCFSGVPTPTSLRVTPVDSSSAEAGLIGRAWDCSEKKSN
ncbi:hypothetical protein HYFRA_00006072 [Hymenoscyphus fraxineus]|uniref:Uncharacterized protein n=1 Tax=Hymenoscyphus fraxineus TaxID=746836 RepID=A0A9N9KVW0_9HELO|nr:hypothetical protein HYFRA_00006072 [Hymenoscyphus fraxineus]